MLHWRLIFAAAILVPLLTLLVVDFRWSGTAPGIWLVPLGLLLALVAGGEVLSLLRAGGLQPQAATVYAGVALVFLASAAPIAWSLAGGYPADCPLGRLGWPLSATVAAFLLIFAGEMLRFREPGQHIANAAAALFVVFYVGLLASFLILLRMFHSNAWGMAALVSLLFVVKLSDVGAYAAGKCFGRRKLVPRLSPGKTVEGAVGGLLAAVAASLIYFAIIVPSLVADGAGTAWWRAALFGLIVAAAGMFGDLCESLLKRDMQRKESSSWLLGLGGVLDVLDSVLVAAPAAFACWIAGLVGPGG